MKGVIFKKVFNLKPVCLMIFLLGLSEQLSAQMKDINNLQLISLMEKKVPIIDIRDESEWQETGIIEGSYLLTFFNSDGKYDLPAWMESLQQIVGSDRPVIILCRSGRRSAIVGKFLVNKENYQEVYNVKYGIKGWIEARLKIDKY